MSGAEISAGVKRLLDFHLFALFSSCWSANGLRCNERLRDLSSFCVCRFWFSFLCCSHFAHESINSNEISFNLQVVDTKITGRVRWWRFRRPLNVSSASVEHRRLEDDHYTRARRSLSRLHFASILEAIDVVTDHRPKKNKKKTSLNLNVF